MSCKNLSLDGDIVNPIVAMYIRDQGNLGRQELLGTTECIANSAHPSFKNAVYVPFPSLDRHVTLCIYDQHSSGLLNQNNLIATASTSLRRILPSRYRKHGYKFRHVELPPELRDSPGVYETTPGSKSDANVVKPEDKRPAGYFSSHTETSFKSVKDPNKTVKMKSSYEGEQGVTLSLYTVSGGTTDATIRLDTNILVDHSKKQPVTLEFNVSCRNLIKMDDSSDSDPMVMVFVRTDDGGWEFFARTEKIDNNHNPNFQVPLKVDTFIQGQLKFSVYDLDEATGDYTEEDLMGAVVVDVADLVESASNIKDAELVYAISHDTDSVRHTALKKKGSAVNLKVTMSQKEMFNGSKVGVSCK